jgi:basic membrane protein A
VSEKTQLYAGIIVALLLGAAIGWVAKPAPSTPSGETVAKSVYDEVVADLAEAETKITGLETDIEELTTDLEDAQSEITELKKPFKVGMITGTGGLGDKSFNDISFSGVTRAFEELGVEYDYVEPTSIAEYEGYQRDFAKSGEYGLIICIGFDQADPLTLVASEYPDQRFALVDMVVDNSNVASLTFRANEGSFLLGVVAGMKSETGKIGFVGGMEIPLIIDFFVGYEAGAKWANPEIEVLTPVYVGDWGDPAKGKELAVSLIEGGADMIFAAGGKSSLGALEAADEKDVTGLGVDACMDHLNENMFASMTKRVDLAVYEMILSAMVDTFEGGFKNGGVKEGWVGMCRLPEEEPYWEELFDFEHPEMPEEIANKVAEAKNKIIAGDIVVPSGYE